MVDITIPLAALAAGVKAFAEAEENAYSTHAEDLRAAFLVMLTAWPGMSKVGEVYGLQQEWWLELPLSQEASDE